MIGAKKNKPIGFIKLNLYEVAQAPSHFDFNLSSYGSYLGRLVFDIKMSQKINVNIKSKQLVSVMNEPLADKFYIYQLELINKDNRVTSELSSDFENVFLNMPNLNKNLFVNNRSISPAPRLEQHPETNAGVKKPVENNHNETNNNNGIRTDSPRRIITHLDYSSNNSQNDNSDFFKLKRIESSGEDSSAENKDDEFFNENKSELKSDEAGKLLNF